MALDDDLKVEHFKHLCEQTRHFNDKLIEALTFFVQTLSVIVGGSIWLALQKEAHAKPGSYELLSNALVAILSVVTLARLLGNYFAWWGYRVAQHKVYPSVPLPHSVRSSWMEVLMALCVVAACLLFWLENPFRVLMSK